MPAPKKRCPAPAPRVVHPHAAGIDVGSEAHVVAVPVDRDPEPVRTFGVFTADLRTLADWLKKCGVTSVVLESTGVYWMSLCDFLEGQGFEVLVIDPRALARNLKKKTDVSDAAWLQELHAFGLLKSCFRPAPEVRALRTLWRHRDHLVTEAARLLQMMQKVLVQMNVHLHLVVADLAGATGLRILRAIAQGQRDPQTLAALRDPNCKRTREEIAKALEGTWDPAHLFELKQLLKAWDFYQNQLHVCDKEYDKAAGKMPDQTEGRPLPKPEKQPFKRRNSPTAFDSDALIFKMTGVRLTEVDGLGANTVLTVLSETGPDLAAKFATDKHFAAWTTLAPRKHQSGKRTKFPAQTASRVAKAFRLAARALLNCKSVLGNYLRRLRARLGIGTAIRATACKLAKLFYRLITKGEAYRRESTEAEQAKHHERQVRALERKARELGLQVMPLSTRPTELHTTREKKVGASQRQPRPAESCTVRARHAVVARLRCTGSGHKTLGSLKG
jgi:transposase